MAYYLDTSAAVKLVLREQGTTALIRFLGATNEPIVAGDLLRTELLRATRRAAPEAMLAARAVLDSVILITMPSSTFERAALLDPAVLRSLDALHLAVAMELGDELTAVITYDDRLASAAASLGINAVAP